MGCRASDRSDFRRVSLAESRARAIDVHRRLCLRVAFCAAQKHLAPGFHPGAAWLDRVVELPSRMAPQFAGRPGLLSELEVSSESPRVLSLLCGLQFNRAVNHPALIDYSTLIGKERECAWVRRLTHRQFLVAALCGNHEAQRPARHNVVAGGQLHSGNAAALLDVSDRF